MYRLCMSGHPRLRQLLPPVGTVTIFAIVTVVHAENQAALVFPRSCFKQFSAVLPANEK